MSISSTRTTIHLRAADIPATTEVDASTNAGLVMINGPDIGRMHAVPVNTTLLIGRDASAQIQLDEASVSRTHARILHHGEQVHVLDLGSTNGTFVNDHPIREQALSPNDLLHVGRVIFKVLMGAGVEASYHQALYRLTTTDPLTEAYNKRYLLENMERELSRARRQDSDVSFVMFDIDHFKQINDTHGHLIGDFVLKHLAARVHARVRCEDLFARYGGEEFALMLPGIDLRHAAMFAEALRGLIASAPFVEDDRIIPVTTSLGVASLRELLERGERPSAADLIAVADARLYEAKRGGRNRVVAA